MFKSLSLKLKITLSVCVILLATMIGFEVFGSYIVRQNDRFSYNVMKNVFDHVRQDNEALQVEQNGRELETFAGMPEVVDFCSGQTSQAREKIIRGFFITLESKCRASRFLLLDKAHSIIFSEKNSKTSVSDDQVFSSERFVKLYQKVAETWEALGIMGVSKGMVFFALVTGVVNDDDETVGYSVIEIPATVIAGTFSEKVRGPIAFQGSDRSLSGSSNETLFRNIHPDWLALSRADKPLIIKSESRAYRAYFTDVPESGESFGYRYWVALPYDDVLAAKQRLAVIRTLVFMGIFIAGIGLLFLVLSRQTAPIKSLVYMLKDIARGQGDLTQRIEIHSRDEVGEVAELFNSFVLALNRIMVGIGQNSEKVTISSCDLLSVSEFMSVGAEDLSMKANSVANASYELSSTMDLISSTITKSTERLGAIADTATSMKSSFHEVTGHCEQVRSFSRQATQRIEHASGRVNRLGDASEEITQVTGVINDIADQTKLLALNATIEAARAGDTGKGFLVVANEIKSLADQTARATVDITDKIRDIRDSSQDTISDVQTITDMIAEFNRIVALIVESVEGQSVHTGTVSNHIQEISGQMKDISENISQSFNVSSDIAQDISGVNTQSDEMLERSKQVKANAGELSDLALKLAEMISIFKLDKAGLEPETSGSSDHEAHFTSEKRHVA